MFIATLSLRGKMETTQLFNERYIIKHIIASTKNATHQCDEMPSKLANMYTI